MAERPPCSVDEAAAWFAGRVPDDWFDGPVAVRADRDEIIVTGTLAAPMLSGGAVLSDGRYSNIEFGTLLTNLDAKADFTQDGRAVFDLTANDGVEGTVAASGSYVVADGTLDTRLSLNNAALVRREGERGERLLGRLASARLAVHLVAPAAHPHRPGTRRGKLDRVAQLRAAGAAERERAGIGGGEHRAAARPATAVPRRRALAGALGRPSGASPARRPGAPGPIRLPPPPARRAAPNLNGPAVGGRGPRAHPIPRATPAGPRRRPRACVHGDGRAPLAEARIRD